MTRRFFTPLLLVGAMVLFSGCGGGGDDGLGGGNGNVDQIRQQIVNAHQIWAEAIEEEDLFTLGLITSPNFLLDGTNRAGYLGAFEEVFNDYNNIDVEEIEITEIDEDSLTSTVAEVYYVWRITGVNRNTNQREVIDETPVNDEYYMIWIFEDGRWKMYGNQENTPAFSTPNANGGARRIPVVIKSGRH